MADYSLHRSNIAAEEQAIALKKKFYQLLEADAEFHVLKNIIVELKALNVEIMQAKNGSSTQPPMA